MKTLNRFNLWAAILALCLGAFPVRAAFHTWTGAVNGYWSNTNNWSGGSGPTVFESAPVELNFPSGVARLHTTNDIGAFFFGGIYGVDVDSLIIGDNYTFSGKGLGTNLFFSGNPAFFFGLPLQNIYNTTPNLTITFDDSLYLYFQNTNTITNAINTTIDFQSTLIGTGGFTYLGSGELKFDGTPDFYSYQGNLTGTCWLQAGIVLLNRGDPYDTGLGLPAFTGPVVLGTTNTANSAILFEYNPQGYSSGQLGNVYTGAAYPMTIEPSGFLENIGMDEYGISSLTMTGGVVVLGSTSYLYCPPNPIDPCTTVTNYGFIVASNITTYAPPSGAACLIESSEEGGYGYDILGNLINPDYEGIYLYPQNYANPGQTPAPATINVVSGTLNITAPLFGYSGNSSNLATFIKTGPGTLGLYGTNAFVANSFIQQGVVMAGGDYPFGYGISSYNWYYIATNTIVESSGAEIIVSGGFDDPVPLVINGYGTNGNSAALVVQSNGAAITSILLGSDSAIQVANPSATLTVGIDSHQYFPGPGGDGWYSYSPLDGAFNFHKTGPGTLELLGHFVTNTMSGTTYVDQGTLVLQGQTNFYNPGVLLLNGPVIVGTNGGVSSATLNLQSSEPINPTNTLPIYAGSLMTIAGTNQQTVNGLILNGGSVLGGRLVLNSNITSQITLGYNPAISSTLSLHGTNRTVNVPALTSLALFGDVIDGGNGAGLTKIGTGDLNLYGTNLCAGATIVAGGRVGALQTGGFLPAGGGVVVSNGTDLLLYNGVNIGAAPLWLTGTGVDGNGCLKSFGTNSWAGTVNLVSNVTVDVVSNVSWPGSLLELKGVITGPTGLTKNGWGNLLLDGSQSNNYTGLTLLQQGLLTLSKTNAGAIPGALTIGQGLDGVNGDIVRTVFGYQLSPSNTVNISSSGLLDLSGSSSFITSIGSLTGSGAVQLGNNDLDCGFDNSTTAFNGSISGTASSAFLKYGTGALTLGGASSLGGVLQVESGQLYVNGSMPAVTASFATGGLLGGTGTVGPFGYTFGTLAPGNNGPGILNSGNLFLNGSDTFLAFITGTTAGSGYSQLNVTGTVSLGGAALALNMPVVGITNSPLVIINNDGADAVTGTFNGLAEGATLTAANGAKFKITYHGGSGNDVVLTQITLPTQPLFTGIARLGGGGMQLNGLGMTNLAYTVSANTNLATATWTNIGTATANGSGLLQYIDPGATNFSKRFYRFSWP